MEGADTVAVVMAEEEGTLDSLVGTALVVVALVDSPVYRAEVSVAVVVLVVELVAVVQEDLVEEE
jgi:hypothetical protein